MTMMMKATRPEVGVGRGEHTLSPPSFSTPVNSKREGGKRKKRGGGSFSFFLQKSAAAASENSQSRKAISAPPHNVCIRVGVIFFGGRVARCTDRCTDRTRVFNGLFRGAKRNGTNRFSRESKKREIDGSKKNPFSP